MHHQYNCSHLRGWASSTSVFVLDQIQRKVIQLSSDTSLTINLWSLSHCWAVASLSIYYHSYFSFRSSDLAPPVPTSLTFVHLSPFSDFCPPLPLFCAKVSTSFPFSFSLLVSINGTPFHIPSHRLAIFPSLSFFL